jgi:uncharacterized membrane protein
MNKINILLAAIIIISFSIRLYPTLLTGLPFSTDSWPIISNTEILLGYTPISLEDDVFDGYNNYWPASQIFGAISSIMLGAKVLDVERILFPAIASLTPIILYIIVKRIMDCRGAAIISSLLLALGGYQAIFTSGVTKETFTLFLFLTYLYLVLATGGLTARSILLSIIGMAIIMGHHLQYFLLIAILSNILVLRLLLRRVHDNGLARLMVGLIILLILGAIYYPLYALRGIHYSLTFSDTLSLISFQAFSLLILYYLLAEAKASRPPISLLAAWAASYVCLLANQLFPIMPGSPKIPANLLMEVSILLMLGLFVILGFHASRHGEMANSYFILGWFSAILSLEAYSMFGSQPSISLTLFYRLTNHILPPALILASIGLVKVMSLFKRRRLGLLCLAVILLPVSLTMVYQHYSSVILQENYLGYQWNYNMAEYEFASWLSRKGDDLKVYGDMKIKYLLEGYFGMSVDEVRGFKILNGESPAGKSLIVTYKVMEKNGYVLGPYGVELKQGWIKSTSDRADKIFSNTLVEAYSIS